MQKVSDTVVILNKGSLVAQGPIEELLAGSEGVVYIVHLKGDIEAACKLVQAQPWVSRIIDRASTTDRSTWQVSVSDPQAAEAELLKLLVNGPVDRNRVSPQAVRAGRYLHAGHRRRPGCPEIVISNW